ncbi:MAG: hypothetical protein V3T70_06425 [Phycisphaerae bacterium]
MRERLLNGRGRQAIFSKLILALAALPACDVKKSKQPESKRKEGVITRIELDQKRITIKIRDPKDRSRYLDTEIEGEITPTTEIFIDGRKATLAEVRVNDQVDAIGYRKGSGDEARIIAEELHIQRGEFVQVKSPPAAGPAADPIDSDAAAAIPETTEQVKPPPAADDAERRIGLYRMMLEEFRKRKQELEAERAELIKQGMPPDDPEILRRQEMINRADESMALMEQKAAELGIDIYAAPEPTEPSEDAPADSASDE